MIHLDPAINAAAGAALIAVLNELRARSRARAAEDDRRTRDAQIRALAAPSPAPTSAPPPGQESDDGELTR